MARIGMAIAGSALLLALAACADDGDPPVTDAEVAERVCGPILDYRNHVAESLAETQREVRQGGASPRDAFLPVLRGLRTETEALGEQFRDLELDRADRARRALDDQLVSGVEVAVASWSDLVATFEAIPDPDSETVTARLATVFVRSEKPVEEVKPEVQDDLGDPGLEAAFAEETSCAFASLR